MKQITITRWNGVGEIPDKRWKELISALVLSGYEVYGDEERIVFILGHEDEVNDKEEE